MFQGPGNPALPQSRTQTHQCRADLPVGESKKAGKDKKIRENREAGKDKKAEENRKAGKDKKAGENRKTGKDKKAEENRKAREDKKAEENRKGGEDKKAGGDRKHSAVPWPNETHNRSAILSVTFHTNHYQTGIGVDQVFSPGRARINFHNNK
ncbi:hypothetical protein [Candidatus Thiosymbion oneisti]|uniref:hypothetical protein n=1 Tax=Candidatus Thiosymbion oneisti TaxID=589554 RepID=UPI000B02A26B|nr:hypothetical protein [Candidatus Thiosymbion oneisti]